MQTDQKIADFLASAGPGRLWVVTCWVDTTGLAWLAEHTPTRPVTLIVDDTRPSIFRRQILDDLSPQTYDLAISFLERDDVAVYTVIRSEGSRVHRKNFVIESPVGKAASALTGSPNLSRFGLFRNEETLVNVSSEELEEVWHQTSSLMQKVQPVGVRLISHIKNAKSRIIEHLASSRSINISAKLPGATERFGNEFHAFLEDWTNCLGFQPCHVQSDSNELRRSAFGWDKLNMILAHQKFDFPRMRVVHREQVRTDIGIGRIDESRPNDGGLWADIPLIYERLKEGGTLVLGSVHECDSTLAVLQRNLQQFFGIEVGINMYCGFRAERGLGLHWDSHDVLIVAIDGRKQWTVYRPTRLFPLDRDLEHSDVEPTEMALDVVLEPGDLLYIPRGWWHDVVTANIPSLHITISLRWRTVADYLHWTIDRLLDHEVVRRDVPTDTAAQEAIMDVVSGLLLNEVDPTSGKLTQYLRQSTAAIRIRPTPALPFGLVDEPLLDEARIVSNCDLMVAIRTTADDVVIEVDDRSFTVSIAFEEVVRSVLGSTGSTTVKSLRKLCGEDLSESAIDQLVCRFAVEGLVTILSPADGNH